MATPVNMPALGESVTEGTVTRWLKQVGDTVEMDEPLLEVSTDKVDTEIPSPVAGVLVSIAADEDDVIEVGGLLGAVGSADEAGAGSAPAEPAPQMSEAPAPQSATAPTVAPTTEPEESEPPPEPAEAEAAQERAPSRGARAEESAGSGTEVRLPELGESVTEGTVTRWLKEVGDDVAADEPLLEISTDKVDTEIPAPAAGTLLRIVADEDDVVAVGGLLGVIGTAGAPHAGEPSPEAAAPAAEPEPEPEAETAAQPAPTAAPSRETQPPQPPAPRPAPPAGGEPVAAAEPQPDGAPYVTPLVRKLAAQAGVDLATVSGSGIGGRIRRQDIEAVVAAKRTPAAPTTTPAPAAAPTAATPPAAAAAAGVPSPLRGRTEKMSRLRKVIAQRMVDSLQVSAQLTTVVEVDVTAIARLRDRTKVAFEAREGVKLSFLPFFAKATVEALRAHPGLNASIDSEAGTVTYHDAEHLGVAVDTERGLLVPVIRDAGDLNIAGLARRIADLAERTRTNRVTPDELSGGTFTLTNTGSRGALFDTPIINQPQVGILGTGSVVRRPSVVAGADGGDVIAVRSLVLLALTYDHRLVDGADAARFLAAVKTRLEDGGFEVDLGG